MRSALLQGVEGAVPQRKKSCWTRCGSAVVRAACLRSSYFDRDMLNDPKGT